MTKKIFRAIFGTALAVLLAGLVFVMGCLCSYYRGVQEEQLKDELSLAAQGVEQGGGAYLDALVADHSAAETDYRLTWVGSDGRVLFDSQADPAQMENHADRTEIREALQNGEGASVRYSATLTENTQYCAKALADGTVLRISHSRLSLLGLILGLLHPFLAVVVLAVILSAVLAHWMAGKIVAPLNSLDLEHPLDNDAYEELAPLLGRIHHQHRQISAQLRSLREKTDQFAQITASMSEGLVLLDNGGTILSMNPAAQRLFGVPPSCVGQSFLTVERDRELDHVIRTALEEGHGELRAARRGREYQFDVSRIQSEGAALGTVVLIFDVTERAFAERNRREFTANVSHELKTPLQSILGSAELLENGMAKGEDVPRFAGLIRTEAARLVALVEDIIHLSQLDEGVAPERERVDLLELAGAAAAALEEKAAARQVRVSVTGEQAELEGVRSFLYEMIYNLCDNAIKYNVEGGSVELSVQPAGERAALTVKDTGVGIPPEYQDRVFERFFRVDKSRSKAVGGTGLGLAIVKHTVQYHRGEIALESGEGGTTITVKLPVEA